MNEAAFLIGDHRAGQILIVADHASNRVPDDVVLGIPENLLDDHIAVDLGVADISEDIVRGNKDIAAYVANVSRLVCDLNRERENCVTLASDGHVVPGNHLSHSEEEARATRFHDNYHGELEALIAAERPSLILSLHSFTPSLASRPDIERPWHVACLYNEDDRAARIALPLFAAAGYVTGDQQPYSGRELNYTMNRHAEANGIPYLGIEMRQDVATDPARQDGLAAIITEAARKAAAALG